MRSPNPGVELDPRQRRMAERGLKPLIPFHGHPYLSYGLTALADAGFRDVCLVVGPDPDPIRAHYAGLPKERLRIAFAVQPEPRGGADAVLAAEAFADGRAFAVLNADNYYPPAALAGLRRLPGDGLVAFRRHALIARSNIPPERLAAFALVAVGEDGCLERIVEKPSPAEARRLGEPALVSMTCWRFGPDIFEACRAIVPSARGELELPDAVMWAVELRGACFRVRLSDEPVLDLGNQADVGPVAAALGGRRVSL